MRKLNICEEVTLIYFHILNTLSKRMLHFSCLPMRTYSVFKNFLKLDDKKITLFLKKIATMILKGVLPAINVSFALNLKINVPANL